MHVSVFKFVACVNINYSTCCLLPCRVGLSACFAICVNSVYMYCDVSCTVFFCGADATGNFMPVSVFSGFIVDVHVVTINSC